MTCTCYERNNQDNPVLDECRLPLKAGRKSEEMAMDSEVCIMWISVVMPGIHIGSPLLNNKNIQGCSELNHVKARMSSTSRETSTTGLPVSCLQHVQ